MLKCVCESISSLNGWSKKITHNLLISPSAIKTMIDIGKENF